MENINILFLAGAKRASLAEEFIRAGKELGKKVSIFSYELNEDVPIAFIGKVVAGRRWTDVDVIEHISKVIEDYKINILLPFVDPAALIASKIKERNKNIFVPVSDIETCEIFFNKKYADSWCEKNEISIPHKNITKFPLIAKPVKGSASKGILILNNEEDLSKIKDRNEYLIQQFVKGKEYTVDIYINTKTSSIQTLVPRERIETQGGESIKSITVKDEAIESFSKSIIEKTRLKGPVTLQLLKNNEGELFFMEINPRFGGGVLNSINAGADSPMCLLRDYLDLEEKSYDNWKNNYMMIRRYIEYYKIKEDAVDN